MCDASDMLHATFKHDSPPTTPPLEYSCTLRRTVSHASVDTVRPPNNKGIRRRIEDIAENLKNKSTKKRRKHASHGVTSDSKSTQENKAVRNRRKATSPLRDASHRSEKQSVLAIADRLHSGVPFELDSPLTFPGYKSDFLVDVPLLKEEDLSLPTRTLQPGAHIAVEHQVTFQPPPTANVKDIQLEIQSSETNATIWDGLRAAHHVFKCRLFLRCITHPYDTVSLPDIRLVEMDCSTCPAGSHYVRLPTLQAAYQGAAPGRVKKPDGLPNVNLAAGIHMDRVWSKILNDDGTWGWYRDTFVPLSPRLFDKMEYREFKLVSQAWVGESCVEGELTFGISMLLREVDMR